ncbi:hypothetical protein [Thalassobacillus sp. CUG 92003]|uniref:hypothetical protein n=1 Tax=Thalassobacillus sp. CUG 92003 TaxID=2736641 RepID=UPI0015E7134E|nr:hypothetical protein [Thalassobacillus sp. CUG 92003]
MKRWLAGIGAVVIAGGLTLATVTDGEGEDSANGNNEAKAEVTTTESTGSSADGSTEESTEQKEAELTSDPSVIESEMAEFIVNEVQAEGRNNRETIMDITVENGKVTYKLMEGTSSSDSTSDRVDELLSGAKQIFTETYENYAVENATVEWNGVFDIEERVDVAVSSEISKEAYEDIGGLGSVSNEEFTSTARDYFEHEYFTVYSE